MLLLHFILHGYGIAFSTVFNDMSNYSSLAVFPLFLISQNKSNNSEILTKHNCNLLIFIRQCEAKKGVILSKIPKMTFDQELYLLLFVFICLLSKMVVLFPL